ncbi:UNVERIFIED_CONTAM: hypothetical protein GTU68_037733 [Idotea baltica]|nr:hypothetical protein [Idotea baltica]
MKAIIATGYGGPEVLKMQIVAKPLPKENEVLIKVAATAVTTATTIMRTGKPYFGRLFLGLTKPKAAIPGTDLAGVVEQVGAKVTQFKVGDKVMAETGVECGTHAEYICLAEDELIVHQPKNLSPEEATGILDGGCTALAFFTDSVRIQKGQKVLINGASGSIGTAAVQLAKHFGAEVTAVCSGKNTELVRSLGADFVVDYTQINVWELPQKYDIIFDTVGKLSFRKCKAILVKKGVFLTPVLTMGILLQMMSSSLFGSKKLKFSATGLRKKALQMRDLIKVQEFLAKGVLKTVIDRKFHLEDIQLAHDYVDMGHKRGNVVISFAS